MIERDELKADALARQRPTWRVYQGNGLPALSAGLASDLAFDIVDLDPHGSSLAYLEVLGNGGRLWPDRWQLVVKAGKRQLPLRATTVRCRHSARIWLARAMLAAP